MKTWIARVQVAMKQPFWVGHFDSPDRVAAKRQARLFVSEILPLDTLILCIAEGSIEVRRAGPEVPMEEERGRQS